ncbi:hydrogenase expression/formation protein HypC [Candidatus Magnetomoraceae bacterium gMMP-15]
MCVAIPSKIIEIDNEMAIVDIDGVKQNASLALIEDARIGDYVIIHAGFAIHKIDEHEAMETLKLMNLLIKNDY